MAHVIEDGTSEAAAGRAKWGVRLDGAAIEIEVVAERATEELSGVHGQLKYVFRDAAGTSVFEVPRERVVYVRLKR